ncbi:MAG: hypothetical protein ABIT01_10875 [Thermoanaerobaculia bacterium]
MVSVTSLWLPILLSAVAVFVASSVIHMLLPHHRSDYKKAPGEDELMDTVRRLSIPPGDYLFPYAGSPAGMKDPEYAAKWKKGPVGMMTVMRSPHEMGKTFILWFLYCVVIGVFAAYVTGHALPAGAHYRSVFRFAGITAFACYGLALWQNSIWYHRSWLTTLKSNLDSLVYGMLTAGIFGWLWPR